MAFGVSGPCVCCEYLKTNDTSGSKVYCEVLRAYIKPDLSGCGRFVRKDK